MTTKLKNRINPFCQTLRSFRGPAVVAVSSVYDGDTGSSRAVYRLQEANPGLTLAVAYVVGNPAASNQHPVGTTYASGDEQRRIAAEPIGPNLLLGNGYSDSYEPPWIKIAKSAEIV